MRRGLAGPRRPSTRETHVSDPDALAVRSGETEVSKRRILLGIGHRAGWWNYESENPPGYVDRAGRRYDTTTYTLVLPQASERVLLADEVPGYVLATADQYGDEAVASIAYRVTLLPRTSETE
jgi:hypothetical protein